MRRTGVRVTAAVLAAGVVAWLVFVVVVIGNPQRAEHPATADAIVVLGPSNKQVPFATGLAHRLGMDQLVLSIGDFPEQTGTCRQPGLQVTCFVPEPYQTVGEAREIGALARERGWDSVIVIAAVPQISRARMLIQRCYPGQLQMVAADTPPLDWVEWVRQTFYQSGAFVKAALDPGC